MCLIGGISFCWGKGGSDLLYTKISSLALHSQAMLHAIEIKTLRKTASFVYI